MGDFIFIEKISSTGLYLVELRNAVELERVILISNGKGLEDSLDIR